MKQNFRLDHNGLLSELFEKLRQRQEEKEEQLHHQRSAEIQDITFDLIEEFCERAAQQLHLVLSPAPASHHFTAPAPRCC